MRVCFLYASVLTVVCRFNDQEIVALSGAHALGRCHTDRSGFEGPWTFSPSTVTNDYYKLLFDEKWKNLPVPRMHDPSDDEDDEEYESEDERIRTSSLLYRVAFH